MSSLPGPILFEPGLTGMGYSGSYPLNRCNHSVGFGHFYPSRSAINSAPFSQSKTHQHQQQQKQEENKFSAFWTSTTQFQKWLATGSGNSATRIPKRLPRDSAKFVLKEGSENSTDSLIELLSESGTSKEEYSSTFLLSLQWVLLQSKDKYSPWNLSWSCCFDNPVKVLINYGSTVP